MSGERPGEMQIGATLRESRERAGLELRAVQEQTMIRARYLQALEEERWDALPSVAYGKGFLRTYAQVLGLDAEAVVDEYRRQVESGEPQSMHPFGDAVLEERRRHAQAHTGPRAGLWLGLAGALVLGAVLVIALVGGGDDEQPAPARADGGGDRPGRDAVEPKGTVELGLAVSEPVELCLVGGGGEALIDGQVLAAGTRESFERKAFELRFPRGFDPDGLKVKLDGDERLLPRAEGPAAYEIVAPRHVRLATRPPKERCP